MKKLITFALVAAVSASTSTTTTTTTKTTAPKASDFKLTEKDMAKTLKSTEDGLNDIGTEIDKECSPLYKELHGWSFGCMWDNPGM